MYAAFQKAHKTRTLVVGGGTMISKKLIMLAAGIFASIDVYSYPTSLPCTSSVIINCNQETSNSCVHICTTYMSTPVQLIRVMAKNLRQNLRKWAQSLTTSK